MKILVVEDNLINRMTLVNFLKEMNYDPFVCSNGKEAFDLWYKERCDLVITDLMMPEMNGIDLIKKIREHEFNAETYIIVLTAYNDDLHVDQSYDGGADDFLAKPFNKKELKQRISIAERIISMQRKSMIVYALIKLAQIKDKDTGEHINRMGCYAKILAKGLMRLPKYEGFINRRYIDDLFASAPLHDIGKVGIDDAILKKKGPLNQDEQLQMKKHIEYGYQTIMSIKDQFPNMSFLEMGLAIIKSHHEKYDGSGYPEGLKGDDIPLSARIVSLADYYDALISERVYKKAFSHQDAFHEIVSLKGTHFDPDIVDVFIEFQDEFKRVCKEG